MTKQATTTIIEDGDFLLTAKQVSSMLSVTTRMVEYMRKNGKLPYIKIGRATRYKKKDVDRFINESYFTGN